MEIRHRKQFLTGKMVAQVRYGNGEWVDAEDWLTDKIYLYDEDKSIREKRNKVKEIVYSAIGADVLTAELDTAHEKIAHLQRKIKKMRKERKALVSDLRGYMKATNEYAKDAETLYRSLQELTSAVENMDMFPPGGESLDRACKAVDAANAVLQDHSEYYVPDQPIPHHGPGLSEAEDAFSQPDTANGIQLDIKPESGVCSPKKQSLCLIIERHKDGQFHFFVQDINTWRVRHTGVRPSESDVWLAIDPEDRACIEQVCHKQGDV